MLHVICFNGSALKQVVNQINATGYGLALDIHSRVNATILAISQHTRVGNG